MMAEPSNPILDHSEREPASLYSGSDEVLRATLGSRVLIHSTNPKTPEVEGVLYTACARTNLLVLITDGPPSPTYRVMPISALTSCTVLALPSTSPPPSTPIPNPQAITHRVSVAVSRARERAAKVNTKVEKTTQDLFDALDKQFTARWKGKDIIVMERVLIKSPGYRPEDCRIITKDGEGVLGRVRKVLEHEKKRAAQKDAGKAVKPAVPMIGLRKGG